MQTFEVHLSDGSDSNGYEAWYFYYDDEDNYHNDDQNNYNGASASLPIGNGGMYRDRQYGRTTLLATRAYLDSSRADSIHKDAVANLSGSVDHHDPRVIYFNLDLG